MKRNHRLTMILSVFVLSLATMLYGVSQRVEGPLPASLGNLHNVKLIEVKDAFGNLLLSGVFTTSVDDDEDGDEDDGNKRDDEDEIELTAVLTGGTNASRVPKGKAEIEIEQENQTMRQALELKAENLAASVNLRLWIDGKEITTFTTDKRGKVALKLTSKRPIS